MINKIIKYQSKEFFLKAKTWSDNTSYGSLELLSLGDKSESRSRDRSSVIYGHPWFLESIVKYFPRNDSIFLKKKLSTRISTILNRNKKKYYFFQSEVNKEEHPNYLAWIKAEVNLDKIFERIENNFYSTKAHLIFDITQIEKNAHIYNEPNTNVHAFATELKNELIQYLDSFSQRLMNNSGKYFEEKTLSEKSSVMRKEIEIGN